MRPSPPWRLFGSSPLARGLRSRISCARQSARIIPARAGFTAAESTHVWAWWDHPRSRGVYVAGGWWCLRRLRIIPARAGFTRRRLQVGRGPPDHPRSRGVYKRSSTVMVSGSGSSPLARGLLQRKPRKIFLKGIIPARAGFTATQHYYSREYQDHPRSRGVYSGIDQTSSTGAGSSPLARGLPYTVK